MLRRMTMAAAAILLAGLLAGPVMADDSCLTDANGAQCDMFLDEYRSDDVPAGTTDIWATDEYVLEQPQDFQPESTVEFPSGDDVLYWDGDSAMIVPEETGPRLEIADW